MVPVLFFEAPKVDSRNGAEPMTDPLVEPRTSEQRAVRAVVHHDSKSIEEESDQGRQRPRNHNRSRREQRCQCQQRKKRNRVANNSIPSVSIRWREILQIPLLGDGRCRLHMGGVTLDGADRLD